MTLAGAATAPALAQEVSVSITSTPANGTHYVAGEAITTRLTMPQIASGAIRNARMKLDIGGIAIPANSVISGSWSKIGGGFINFNHNVLSNQPAHRVYGAPAYLSATNPASLTEATLNGATVTVSLGGLTYASGVSASSFALVANPAIAGLSIGNVTGATTATLTLATGAGYGFNTPATLAVRVRAAAHSGSPDLTSGTLAVSPTPGVTLSRRSLVLEEDPGTTNAHRGAYTVVLDSPPTQDVTVTIASADTGAVTLDDTDGDATNGVQDTLTFTAGDWGTAGTLTFTVSLSHASQEQVTVAYADAGTGTATADAAGAAGADYVTIPAGDLDLRGRGDEPELRRGAGRGCDGRGERDHRGHAERPHERHPRHGDGDDYR